MHSLELNKTTRYCENERQQQHESITDCIAWVDLKVNFFLIFETDIILMTFKIKHISYIICTRLIM